MPPAPKIRRPRTVRREALSCSFGESFESLDLPGEGRKFGILKDKGNGKSCFVLACSTCSSFSMFNVLFDDVEILVVVAAAVVVAVVLLQCCFVYVMKS